MFLFRKNKKLIEDINDYLQVSESGMESFDEAIQYYFEHGIDPEFEFRMEKLKKIESNADGILHNIERSLYEKSLLPESREDIMVLFEKLDDIIDCSIHILRYIYTRDISFPEIVVSDVKESVRVSLECCAKVREAVEDLFGKRRCILDLVRTIDNYESICDGIKTRAIKKIFRSDLDGFEKILLAEITTLISKISDHCEDSADLINICNLKRVV